jgi:Lipocalin-like domain
MPMPTLYGGRRGQARTATRWSLGHTPVDLWEAPLCLGSSSFLVSADATTTNGRLLGANPRGIFVLDAGGRYALISAKRDRPKISGGREGSAEELKTAAQGLVAQFGTWSVYESDKTLVRRVEGALFPNAEGTDQKSSVSVDQDELKLGNTVYRRAK